METIQDSARILCVEQQPQVADRCVALFPDATVVRETRIGRVLEHFETQGFDLLTVTEPAFNAGELDGQEILDVVVAKSPATQILFLVNSAQMRAVLKALRDGGHQYLKLPLSDEELRLLVETALEKRPPYAPNLLLKRKRPVRFGEMVGRSTAMQQVYRQIRQAAATDIPVLVTGETGTGKELAAQAVHQKSSRAGEPFMPMHLGALPSELVASELFGHVKGSFTGAIEDRVGAFEQAGRGTVLLDEISTINEKVQISLLRLLEQKNFRRIGGSKVIEGDIRLIAASNEDLRKAVSRGVFREDLYFRLDVFHIVMPPLRDRHGDIPLLIGDFLADFNEEFNHCVAGISPDCLAILESYDWPGNVRELRNVIQRAVLVCHGETLMPEHLPPRLQRHVGGPRTLALRVGMTLAEAERELIARTLTATNNNRTEAASILGISRRCLYDKLARYGLK